MGRTLCNPKPVPVTEHSAVMHLLAAFERGWNDAVKP